MSGEAVNRANGHGPAFLPAGGFTSQQRHDDETRVSDIAAAGQ
jgi:hypothetical protein